VQAIILNDLLFWANRYIQSGADTARSLLPSYTNVLSLELCLPEQASLHARPVALIVGIVNRYGTPVEMEVGGLVANASSILKMLMLVGSNAEERAFIFRGDERPLRDIELLFEHGLGEKGLDALPSELAYLRER
jgi:phosphotransferase system HPr-like phosphotransfer protein